MKRSHNEDNFFLLAEENLYIVADGMGGHASGEVASQIAVETLANFFIDTRATRRSPGRSKKTGRHLRREPPGDRHQARQSPRLRVRPIDQRYRGMGTTIVCLCCGPWRLRRPRG